MYALPVGTGKFAHHGGLFLAGISRHRKHVHVEHRRVGLPRQLQGACRVIVSLWVSIVFDKYKTISCGNAAGEAEPSEQPCPVRRTILAAV